MVEAEIDYRVVKGDTLWEFDQQYDVTVDNIKAENDLPIDLILIDEILQISEHPTSVIPLSTLMLKKTECGT